MSLPVPGPRPDPALAAQQFWDQHLPARQLRVEKGFATIRTVNQRVLAVVGQMDFSVAQWKKLDQQRQRGVDFKQQHQEKVNAVLEIQEKIKALPAASQPILDNGSLNPNFEPVSEQLLEAAFSLIVYAITQNPSLDIPSDLRQLLLANVFHDAEEPTTNVSLPKPGFSDVQASNSNTTPNMPTRFSFNNAAKLVAVKQRIAVREKRISSLRSQLDESSSENINSLHRTLNTAASSSQSDWQTLYRQKEKEYGIVKQLLVEECKQHKDILKQMDTDSGGALTKNAWKVKAVWAEVRRLEKALEEERKATIARPLPNTINATSRVKELESQLNAAKNRLRTQENLLGEMMDKQTAKAIEYADALKTTKADASQRTTHQITVLKGLHKATLDTLHQNFEDATKGMKGQVDDRDKQLKVLQANHVAAIKRLESKQQSTLKELQLQHDQIEIELQERVGRESEFRSDYETATRKMFDDLEAQLDKKDHTLEGLQQGIAQMNHQLDQKYIPAIGELQQFSMALLSENGQLENEVDHLSDQLHYITASALRTSSHLMSANHRLSIATNQRNRAFRNQVRTTKSKQKLRTAFGIASDLLVETAVENTRLQRQSKVVSLRATTLASERNEIQGELRIVKDKLTSTSNELITRTLERDRVQGELTSTSNELTTRTLERDSGRGELISTTNELITRTLERDTIQGELQSVRGKLTSTRDKLTSKKLERAKVQGEVQIMQYKLTSTNNELTIRTSERTRAYEQLRAVQTELTTTKDDLLSKIQQRNQAMVSQASADQSHKRVKLALETSQAASLILARDRDVLKDQIQRATTAFIKEKTHTHSLTVKNLALTAEVTNQRDELEILQQNLTITEHQLALTAAKHDKAFQEVKQLLASEEKARNLSLQYLREREQAREEVSNTMNKGQRALVVALQELLPVWYPTNILKEAATILIDAPTHKSFEKCTFPEFMFRSRSPNNVIYCFPVSMYASAIMLFVRIHRRQFGDNTLQLVSALINGVETCTEVSTIYLLVGTIQRYMGMLATLETTTDWTFLSLAILELCHRMYERVPGLQAAASRFDLLSRLQLSISGAVATTQIKPLFKVRLSLEFINTLFDVYQAGFLAHKLGVFCTTTGSDVVLFMAANCRELTLIRKTMFVREDIQIGEVTYLVDEGPGFERLVISVAAKDRDWWEDYVEVYQGTSATSKRQLESIYSGAYFRVLERIGTF